MRPLAFFLLFLPALYSQTSTISGTVLDPQQRAIAGATLKIGSQTATADTSGKFRVEGVPNGAATLTVTAIGFKTASLDLTVAGNLDPTIQLELGGLSDSVLVTTARGTAVALEEAGISATIFDEQDLHSRNFNRVADVLRDSAGLNIVQTGSNGGITSLFGRGGDSNAVVVLLDGIPVTDPGGSINLTGLSTPGLERIEIVRGPQSSLYGAEAASGVIQLFTKRGDPESNRVHGEASYERGSFSTDHWTTSLNGGLLGRLDYSLTADQFRSTGEFANNAFRSTTGTGNIGFHISDRTSIRGLFREFDAFTGAPGQTALQAYNLDARQSDRDSVAGARLEDIRNSWFSQTATYGFHRLRTRNQDSVGEAYQRSALVRDATGGAVYFVRLVPTGTTPDPGTRLVSTSISTFPGGSLQLADRNDAGYQATMNHKGGTFIAGYDFERQSGIITDLRVDRANNGFSFFDQFAWRQRLFVSAGARLEHSSIFGTRFAPRGAVTFRLPTSVFLRLSLSRGIKQPTLLESFAVNSFYVGNPKLRPAQTDTFEAGLTREWWNRRIKTEAAYFRNRYTDLIQFVFATPSTWQNIDRSRSRGIELSASVKLTPYAAIRTSYTRLNTRILSSVNGDAGQTLVRRPQNSGTASLELTPKRFTAIVGARFVGTSRDSFASFGVNRITAYNTAYMSVSWQATPHFSPFLRINNMFDESYQEVSGYAAWSRNALGGVRVTF